MKTASGKINWTLIVVLVIAMAVLAGTAVGLRWWNRGSRAQAGLTAGNAAYEDEQWNEAATELGRYLGVHPDDPEILVKYARAQLRRVPMRTEFVHQAISGYRQALRQDLEKWSLEERREAATELAELYLQVRMPAEAVLIAEDHLALENDVEVRRLLAMAQLRQRDFAAAVKHLEQIVEEDPSQVPAYAMLAQIAAQEPLNSSATPQQWYDEAVRRNPESAQAYAQRSAFYIAASRKAPAGAERDELRAKADEDLKRAEELAANDSTGRLSLAQVLISDGQIDRAEKHLQAALESDPKNLTLWLTWANLASRSPVEVRNERIRFVADRGLEYVGEENASFLPLAAEMYIQAGELDKASECLARLEALEMAPDRLLYLRGLLAEQQQDPAAALEIWQRVLNQDGGNEAVNIKAAFALAQLGDRQSAIHQLRLFVEQNRESFEAVRALAQLLAQSGDFAAAAEQARQATALRPDITTPDGREARRLHAQYRLQLAQPGSGDARIIIRNVRSDVDALRKAGDDSLDLQLLEMQTEVVEGSLHAVLQRAYEQAEQQAAAEKEGDLADSCFDRAARIADRIRADHPETFAAALAPIRVQIAQGDLVGAEASFDKLIKDYPQSLPAVLEAAKMYRRQFVQAEKDLSGLDESSSDSTADAQRLRELRDRAFDRAAETLREAAARLNDPAAAKQAAFLLADLYGSRGRFGEAFDLLQTMEADWPKDIPLKRRLLDYSRRTGGDVDQQQKWIDQIKELEGPRGWQWKYEQAMQWSLDADDAVFKSRYNQILSLLQENLSANPTDDASRRLLASCYARASNRLGTGDWELAISAYRTVLDQNPQDPQAYIMLIGALKAARKGSQEIQEVYDLAEIRGIDDPRLTQMKAGELAAQGDYASAQSLLEQSLRQNPEDQNTQFNLALIKTRQEDYDAAMQLLEGIRRENPDSVMVVGAMLDVLVGRQETEQALAMCDDMIRRHDDATSWGLRAMVNARREDMEQAEKDFEIALSKESDPLRRASMKVSFYRTAGQPEKALEAVREGLKIQPDSGALHKQAAQLLLDSPDPQRRQEGRDHHARALTLMPNDPDLLLIQARLLAAQNTGESVRQAVELLTRLTTANPGNETVWTTLAQVHLGQQDYARALGAAMEGLAALPESRSLTLVKAQCEAQRSPVQAIPTLEMLHEKQPEDLVVALALANTYARAGEYDNARRLLDTFQQRVTGEELLRVNSTRLAAMTFAGQYDPAWQFYRQLRQQSPEAALPAVTFASALIDRGQWNQVQQVDEQWRSEHSDDQQVPRLIVAMLTAKSSPERLRTAQTILEKTVEANPDAVDSMNQLAVLYYETGQVDKAEPLYRKVLAAEPHRLSTINNLAWLLSEDRNKPQEALTLAMSGVEVAPENADLRDTLGTIQYRLGQFESAAQNFRQALRLYRTDQASNQAGTHYRLGLALFEQGQRQQAREHFRTALRTDLLSTEQQMRARELLQQVEGN